MTIRPAAAGDLLRRTKRKTECALSCWFCWRP